MSEIQVNKLSPQSGTTVTLGDSGDTFTIPSGATITNSGTATGFGGDNTPAFEVKLSSNQASGDATWTKIQFNSEVFDTDNAYDNSTNYRFNPQTAGKYFIYIQILTSGNANGDWNEGYGTIYKNGSEYALNHYSLKGTNSARAMNHVLTAIIDMNGSSDYLEGYAYLDDTATGSAPEILAANATRFGGYRILT
tara:strand:+ start:694 stop:1275 length:582 start_codon:yes stop_codon:yes gene_type:complete